MTLADRLADLESERRRVQCRVAVVLDELDLKDRKALQAALDVPKHARGRLTARMIAEALTTEGYSTGYKHVEHHRRNVCGCEPC